MPSYWWIICLFTQLSVFVNVYDGYVKVIRGPEDFEKGSKGLQKIKDDFAFDIFWFLLLTGINLWMVNKWLIS